MFKTAQLKKLARHFIFRPPNELGGLIIPSLMRMWMMMRMSLYPPFLICLFWLFLCLFFCLVCLISCHCLTDFRPDFRPDFCPNFHPNFLKLYTYMVNLYFPNISSQLESLLLEYGTCLTPISRHVIEIMLKNKFSTMNSLEGWSCKMYIRKPDKVMVS